MDAPVETSPSRAWPDDWFGFRGFCILLSGFILAAFPDVIFGWRTFFYRDFGIFGYPLAFYHRESFWRGEIPLWNPFNNSGLPFLAQWNTMVMYPFSMFYVLFPLSWSLGVFCLLHVLWAGAGAFRLAEQWTGNRWAASLAGLVFACNGLTFSCLKWPNNIAALSWMPWLIWLAQRAWQAGHPWTFWAALAGGIQMLTGGPEIILFTWLVIGVLWSGEMARAPGSNSRRTRFQKASGLVWIVLLAVAIASVQLLPFLELLQHSQRGAAYSDTSWSMPWWGPANFLLPLLGCFPSHQGVYAQPGQYWISSYYAGAFVLALGALALWSGRRNLQVWLLTVIALGCLIMALGPEGRLYSWLFEYAPPIRVIRFPIKFVVPVVFVIAILAALALEELDRRRRSGARLIIGTCGACVALTIGIFSIDRFNNAANETTFEHGANAALRLFMMLLATVVLLLLYRQRSTVNQRLLRLAFLVVIWVDLMTHAPRLTPTIERWVYEPDLAKTKLNLQPPPVPGASRAMVTPWADFRLNHLALTNAVDDYLFSRFSLFANVNLLDRIPKVDGFFSLSIEEENRVRYWLYSSTNAVYPALQDFLAVSHMTAAGKVIDWQSRTNFLPWVTAGQTPVFLSGPDTLRALMESTFDPRRVVFLENTNMATVPSNTQQQTTTSSKNALAVLKHFGSSKIQIEVKADTPTWTVISQSYYPAWRAYVNGRETTLHRANHAFQAVQVPAGTSNIDLVYTDRAFQIGAGVSLLALLTCGLGIRRTRVSG